MMAVARRIALHRHGRFSNFKADRRGKGNFPSFVLNFCLPNRFVMHGDWLQLEKAPR